MENCGVIYNNSYSYNELSFLWEKVSSLFEFCLIKYEKYSLNDNNNEKIIYHDSETQIIIVIKNLIIFDVYAIRDEIEKIDFLLALNHPVIY